MIYGMWYNVLQGWIYNRQGPAGRFKLYVLQSNMDSYNILNGPATDHYVLRPATSTQVFLGFPVSISKC